ncbi:MAG: alpha-2-macroglobulin [Treponema sp.]|jgi:uncharacterized protein YfaS (alpha-2-macroglobulin family)|nr:alpha-2-macroglobulin [Treponema sp.]
MRLNQSNCLRAITIGIAGLMLFAACKPKEMPSETVQQTTVFSGSHLSAGKPVSELASYRIAYFEAAEAAAEESFTSENALVAESDEPFTIVDYGPSGELPHEIKKPAIYAVFSQPVVPLARLGVPVRDDPGSPSGVFSIEPPLAGIYRWYGSRLLSFEPDEESLPQQVYRVTVSDQIKSLGGKPLEGRRSFNFETERLSLLNWSLGGGERFIDNDNAYPKDAKHISLIFSYPVNLDEIKNWLEIHYRGRSWAFTLGRLPQINEKRYKAEQGVLLTLNEEPPLDTSVELKVLAGARSEAGWLGSLEEKNYNFHTLLPFTFENISIRSESRPNTNQWNGIPVYLMFSQAVNPESTAGVFSIDGVPPITKDNIQVYGSTVVLNGLPLDYEHSYNVRISEQLKDLWGRSLGRPVTIKANVEAANSYVYIKNTRSHMLEAAFPPKIVWEGQNPISIKRSIRSLSSLYERIPLQSLQPMDLSIFPRNSKHFFIDDLLPFLGPGGKGTVGFRWEYRTPSWDKSRINTVDDWLTVQVTDIGLTVRYAYNKVLVWATRLSTGAPVADARVELMEGTRTAFEGTTDARGLAVFNFPAGVFRAVFSEPTPYVYNNNDDDIRGRGFRIKVSEKGGALADGDEVEFIPNSSHNIWRFGVEAFTSPFAVENDKPVIFLFTDRGLYRPGETVTFRGIDRILKQGKYEAFTGNYGIQVSGASYDTPLVTSLRGKATVNGGSYGTFTLPRNLEPGTYSLRYLRGDFIDTPGFARGNAPNWQEIASGKNAVQSITFTVANFERLRIESSLKFPDIVNFTGNRLSGDFSASYLAGGSLSGAPYTYYWTREPAGFNPGANWNRWYFGPSLPDGRSYISEGRGNLGADGKAVISLTPAADGVEGAAYRYRLEASVQDAARQEISSRGAVIVHPASFYIGARIDSGNLSVFNPSPAASSAYFLPAGKPASLSWALVSPDGTGYAGTQNWQGDLTAQLIRYEWKQTRQAGIGGRVNLVWEKIEELVEERKIELNVQSRIETGAGRNFAGYFNFTPEKSGQWEIRLHSRDREGRAAVTMLHFYVSGAGWVRWGSDDVDSISLTPDQDMYAAGDTAKLLVRSPLPKGSYLLTVEREGIIFQNIIELDGSALTIDIPIKEEYVPIVYVSLSSYTVRSGPPENTYYEPDLDKPKGIFGLAALYVDNTSRHYQIEIESAKGVYGPAEEAEIRLKVMRQGKPVPRAEVTFMAVDRGVVDLIDYHVNDPLKYFYNPRNFPLAVQGADSRSLLIDPVTYSLSSLQGGDDEDTSKLDERKDFRPTAVFEPFLITGNDGTVTVKFKLPDSLTTYRCTAVAAGMEDFGLKEYDLRVSAPLTAVAALPRKLRWRDTGTASLILTNLEKTPVEAAVSLDIIPLDSDAADAENMKAVILEVDGPRSQILNIPPSSTMEVSFRLAAVGSGDAQLAFNLRSPRVNERILRNIAVERPTVYETVSTIGSLGTNDQFMEEGVVLPSHVSEGTGSLSVTLAASRLAQLKEAIRYLLDYPYGCLEQRTASLLPLVAFGEYIDSMGLETKVQNIKKVIEDELVEIGKSRLGDGSYPYWPGGRYGNVFVTLRIAHTAILAKQKGYTIPASIDVQRIFSFLGSGDAMRILNNDPFLKGYALWIRAMYGEKIGSEINSFLTGGDKLGISGWSFAGLAAFELGIKDTASSALERVRRFIRPGTRTLELTDTYERMGNFWGYDADRYALALMLFQALRPDDDMTTRLTTALIERQRRGTWSNTASSFWAVLAFGKVADSEAVQGINLTARAELDSQLLVSGQFNSYVQLPLLSVKSFGDEPLAGMKQDTLLPLRISREGNGRLFYTASLRYGIPTELAGMRDEGIGVFVETFDSEGQPVTDGILIPGKTYTRRLTVSTSRDRTFVALRAPIPSGAEVLDAAFVTTSTVPPEESGDESGDRYRRYDMDYFDREWYEEPPVQFIMDNEVRFCWDWFPRGKKEAEFRFRAVMPGVYPTPPASAECMYEEEVFGRSGGELIRIQGE